MAEPIDVAFVEIRPDFHGFRAEAARGIKRELAGVGADVNVGGGTAAAATAAAASGVKGAEKDVTAIGKAARASQSSVTGLAGSMALLGGSAGRFAAFGAAGGIAAIGASAGIAAVASLRAAQQFETAFAGVRKTVQATDAQLKTLSDGFIDLSTKIPIAATELAGIGQAAGALGVHTNAIIGFTDTVAKLAATTDLTADEAADALARIANVTQLPQSQFSNLGAAILKLGITSAATEPEIAAFALRISGAGRQIGLTVGEITGFGAALASVGVEAEAGGTAISTTFIKIAKAVDTGGKQLANFAKIAGLSSDAFAQEFRDKPAQAILAFIEGLHRVKTEGGSVFAALDSIGLGGIRVRDSLLRASGAGKLFADSLKTGNQAFKDNDALNKAAAARFDTTAARVQILKNEITGLEISVGRGLNRALGQFAVAAGDAVKTLRNSDDAVAVVRNALDDLKVAVGPVILAFRGVGPEIHDAIGDLGRIFATALAAARPLLLVLGTTFAVSARVAVKALTTVIDIADKLAAVWRRTVEIVVAAIDKFLGAFSSLAGVVNKALPGDPLGGIQGAIDGAREKLRSFGTDLDAIDGKVVTASVNVNVNLPSLTSNDFLKQLGGVGKAAADAVGSKVSSAVSGAAAGAVKSGKPPAFGQPGFKPSDKGVADPTVGFFDPKAEVSKALQIRNQRLQDEVELAKTRNETTKDDIAALNALADFSQKQADNIGLSVQIRRQFLIQANTARQEIRGIHTQEAEDAAQARKDEKTATDKRASDAKARRDAAVAARESILQANLQIAKTTAASTADDRRALVALKNFYAERVRILTLRSAAGKAALASEKGAIADIKALDAAAAKARADARAKKSEQRLSQFEDAVTLAKLTRGTDSDDLRALRAEKGELARQIAGLKANDPLRRQLKIQWQQVTNDIEDITKAKADAAKADAGAFQKASFEFLTNQQGFIGGLLGNLLPGGVVGGLLTSSAEGSPTGSPTNVPRPPRPGDVGSGVTPGPAIDLANARATGDARNGLTQGQANQLLGLTRQMLDALNDIKQAGKFPEAGVGRSRAKHAQEGMLF